MHLRTSVQIVELVYMPYLPLLLSFQFFILSPIFDLQGPYETMLCSSNYLHLSICQLWYFGSQMINIPKFKKVFFKGNLSKNKNHLIQLLKPCTNLLDSRFSVNLNNIFSVWWPHKRYFTWILRTHFAIVPMTQLYVRHQLL